MDAQMAPPAVKYPDDGDLKKKRYELWEVFLECVNAFTIVMRLARTAFAIDTSVLRL